MNRDKKPTVRPRYVWLGLVVGLVGAVVIGLGVSFESWLWGIAGVVVLAVGAAMALDGGVMYDAHQSSVAGEVQQAVHGEKREGIKPGEMIEDQQVRRKSYELDEVRHAATAGSHDAPHPPLANLGAILVLLVGVFLLGAQWSLYPTGYQPQTNANWALGFAMLCSAGALRILFGEPGRHLLSTAAIVLSGVGLLLRAFLATHAIEATAVAEAVCGVLLLVAGVMALVSPATELEQLPTQREPDRVPDLHHAGHSSGR